MAFWMVSLDGTCFRQTTNTSEISFLFKSTHQCQRVQLPARVNQSPHLLAVNNAKLPCLPYRDAGTCIREYKTALPMVHITRIGHAVPLSNICMQWRRGFVKRSILHMSLSQREVPAAAGRPSRRVFLGPGDASSILMRFRAAGAGGKETGWTARLGSAGSGDC